MKRILSCTDGSVYAPSIYHYSAWAAKLLDAEIHVLHVLDPLHQEPLNLDFSGSIGLGASSVLIGELVELEATQAKIALKRCEVILDDAVQNFRKAGIENVTTLQRHERLSDSIEKYNQTTDLVVIGKRGNHANFATGHLGNNLERVIKSCKHPVLVASMAIWPMRRFVLAFDGGPSSKKAVEYAVSEPLLKGMECHIIHVGKIDSKTEIALREAQSKLASAGYEVCIELLSGHPEKVISKVIDKDESDLLVMGAYGHSRLRQMLLGSTTSAMIKHTKRPVLLFR